MYFFDKKEIKTISVEQAYLAILKNDLDLALNMFFEKDCSRSRWGIVLVKTLKGENDVVPTYFEIRNFYEIDLDFFIKNKKFDYVDLLLNISSYWIEINQEIYKYIARVLFENKIDTLAVEYLEKSKNILYNDPEMHFMFAKYFLNIKEYENSYYHIKECLKVVPDYYPARKIFESASKHLV